MGEERIKMLTSALIYIRDQLVSSTEGSNAGLLTNKTQQSSNEVVVSIQSTQNDVDKVCLQGPIALIFSNTSTAYA